MPEQYLPRICPNDGNRLQKLKTNRVLNIAGCSPINDYGVYFSDSQGKVTNVFGFYKCPFCGLLQSYELLLEVKPIE